MSAQAPGGQVSRSLSRARRLVANLAPDLRLVDDGRQWIIEKRKGRATRKSTGWRSCGYARSRVGIYNVLGRLGHRPDLALVAALAPLPETYSRGWSVF